MNTREEVLEMLAAGRISPEEADALLEALEQRRHARRVWISNPIEVAGPRAAITMSLLAMALGLLLSRLGVRFDGVVEVHIPGRSVPLVTAILDQLVAWPFAAFVLWTAARLAGGRGRLVDLASVTGLARLPLDLVALIAVLLLPLPRDPQVALSYATYSPSLVLLVVVLVLPPFVLSLVWLYRGFRTVSRVAPPRLVVSFVAGLLAAEVAAKLLLLVGAIGIEFQAPGGFK